MGRAAEVMWFVIAWAFIIALLLKRWREREHRDQQATEDALASTRPHVGSERYLDGA